MPLAGAREAGLDAVVADERLEAVGQGAARELHPPNRGGEVVVDRALGHPADVGEGSDVSVEEGELVLALVEPDEVPPRVHQPHQEEPGLASHAGELDHDLEEVDLGLVARAVDQRHVDLGALPAPLAEVLEHEAHPDVVALLTQRPVEPPARDALLRRGALGPLLGQLLKPRPHLLQHRPRPLPPPWLRQRRREVAPHRVAREPHLPRHLALALALDEHLAPQRVHVLHAEHPFLPTSCGLRRHKGGSCPGVAWS